MNRSPRRTVRESIEKPSITCEGSPPSSRPPTAAATAPAVSTSGTRIPLTSSHPLPRTAAQQRVARYLYVVEPVRTVADDLHLLVSFACKNHQVSGLGQVHCPLYCCAAVDDRQCVGPADHAALGPRLHRSFARLRHAAHHLVDDGGGILGPRIVGRDDDDVAHPTGDRAHQRALGPIAVTPAAEHG